MVSLETPTFMAAPSCQTETVHVVMTEDQVRRLPGGRGHSGRVVPLTPLVRQAASGLRCVDGNTWYGTAEQAQTLEMLARLQQACEDADQRHTLPPAVATTVRNMLIVFASTTARLKHNIGPGPWAIWTEEGWRQYTDADRAAEALALAADWEPPFANPPPIFLDFAISWAGKAVAWLLCGRPIILFESLERGFAPLAAKIAASRERTICLDLIVGRTIWRSLRHLATAAVRRQGIIHLPVPAGRDHRWDDAVRAYIKDALPWAPPGLVDRVTDAAALTSRLSAEMTKLVRASKPAIQLSFQMRWMKGAAVAQACGDAGVKRVLISHGSHPLPEDDQSAIVLKIIADGLLTSPLADEFWLQSPHAEKSLEWLMPDSKAAWRRVRPLVWGYQRPPKRPSGAKNLRILHAGTYKPIIGHRPRMYETADDYVESVRALAEAVAGDPRFELVIRPRVGAECNEATLRAAIPAADNIVVDGSGAFLDALAQTDLLVSDSSTTIEEALAARIPVLQWSSRGHYFHLPPRFTPPSAQDRTAVYGVAEASGLGPMLSAIFSEHLGHPLTDRELEGHLWPADTPDMDTLAAELVALATRT